MPNEIVDNLIEINPQVIVDGTFGAGGHSRRLLAASSRDDLVLIGLDRDPEVSRYYEQNTFGDPRLTLFVGSYEKTPKAMQAMETPSIQAMVLDLGSPATNSQTANADLASHHDSPLDLRFDQEIGHTAAEWLAWSNEKEIADAIYRYGEERCSRRIARRWWREDEEEQPIRTVGEMAKSVANVPRSKNHDIHPATRTFQAFRIVVNDELGGLERTLNAAADWFEPGGRLAIISFHSLEDRMVKQAFRDDERWNPLTKKPLRPTDHEVRVTPAAEAAKLRIAQRNPH